MDDKSCVLVADISYTLMPRNVVIPAALVVIIRFVVMNGVLHYSIDYHPTFSPTDIACEELPDEAELKRHGSSILRKYVSEFEQGVTVRNFNVRWRD